MNNKFDRVGTWCGSLSKKTVAIGAVVGFLFAFIIFNLTPSWIDDNNSGSDSGSG